MLSGASSPHRVNYYQHYWACFEMFLFQKRTELYGHRYINLSRWIFKEKPLHQVLNWGQVQFSQSWLKTVTASPKQLEGVNSRESLGTCLWALFEILSRLGIQELCFLLVPTGFTREKWGEKMWHCAIGNRLGNNIWSRKRMPDQSWTLRRNKHRTQVH